jgi:hypothetical protein
LFENSKFRIEIMKNSVNKIVKESFYALTSFLAVLTLLELVFPRMVLSYVNLNFVLLLWLIFAIISITLRQGKEE